jgi:hypothetical protein
MDVNRTIKVWALRFALGFGVICSMGGSLVGAVSAQDAATAGVIPDAALCQAEPRTVDELIAIFDGETLTEPVVADSVEVPTGAPASQAATDGVTAAITEAVACLNAGDFLRFFSLLTEHAIITAFPWVGMELATNGPPPELENPRPAPAEMQQSIVSVADVRSFDDGRAGAFLVIVDPSSGSLAPSVLHLTFAHDGENWLIDEVIEFNSDL